jgi:hypothetical protein
MAEPMVDAEGIATSIAEVNANIAAAFGRASVPPVSVCLPLSLSVRFGFPLCSLSRMTPIAPILSRAVGHHDPRACPSSASHITQFGIQLHCHHEANLLCAIRGKPSFCAADAPTRMVRI